MSKKDINKWVYVPKHGRFGDFYKIEDYNTFSKPYDESNFTNCSLFLTELLGNLSDCFWRVESNFNCCYSKEEVREHFDKKIKDLEDELSMWKQKREKVLEKCDEVFTLPFEDLSKNTEWDKRNE